MIVLLLGIITIFCILNWRVRKTTAYANFYRTIHVVKDVPKEKKYKMGAFGSTFGYYAFDIKEYGGHNFSVEPQSMIYMQKTVRHFLDNIEEGGYALISLAGCFFATESTTTDEECITYYSFLKPKEFDNYRRIVKIKYILKRYLPALSPYYIKCIIHDEKPKYSTTSGLSTEHGLALAKRRVEGWERVVQQTIDSEFVADAHLNEVLQRNIGRMRDLIEIIQAKKINPVLVILPMSEAFNQVCAESFYKQVLYKCLNQLRDMEITILDYLHDKEIGKIENYMTADCLNEPGRIMLSSRVVNDLKIKNHN